MEFILDFLIYPVIFLFSFISGIFTLNFFTIILFVVFSFLFFKYYVIQYNKVIRIFFYILFFCITLTAVILNFFDLSILIFVSYFLSPFEIISLIGIIVGIVLKEREKKNYNEKGVRK